jgi:hypothetical protein
VLPRAGYAAGDSTEVRAPAVPNGAATAETADESRLRPDPHLMISTVTADCGAANGRHGVTYKIQNLRFSQHLLEIAGTRHPQLFLSLVWGYVNISHEQQLKWAYAQCPRARLIAAEDLRRGTSR